MNGEGDTRGEKAGGEGGVFVRVDESSRSWLEGSWSGWWRQLGFEADSMTWRSSSSSTGAAPRGSTHLGMLSQGRVLLRTP